MHERKLSQAPAAESILEPELPIVDAHHHLWFQNQQPLPQWRAAMDAVVWNTFKRIAAGASQEEKKALFSRTATRVYRLEIG